MSPLTGFKKRIVLLVVLTMLVSMMPTAFAATDFNFVDFPTGWSKEAVTAAVNNGLLRGFEGNEIRPQANLTRAELATIVTRAFGATVKADISGYTDVATNAWYYDSIAKAVQMGILKGVSSTNMAPENYITREDVFTAVARALVLSSDDHASLARFHDAASISEYAKAHIAELSAKNYVNGDNAGNLNPKAYITREEFAQFMHNLIKTYITKPGTYTNDFAGMVVVRVGDVYFKDAIISGDLVIGDGVGLDKIEVTNTTIKGRFLARAGTITIKNATTESGVVVYNPNGTTCFNNTGKEQFFKEMEDYTVVKFIISVGSGGSGGSGTRIKVDVIFKLGYTPEGAPNDIYRDGIQVSDGRTIGAQNIPAEDPTRTGYRFKGWYLNGTEVTAATIIHAPDPIAPVIITAEWELRQYTIAFQDENGDDFLYFKDDYTPDYNFDIESVYTLPNADDIFRLGYDFDGWYDAENNRIDSLAVDADTPISGVVLKAKFTPKEYTVTYKNVTFADGSSTTQSYTIESIPTLPDETALTAESIPEGYYLAYWKDSTGIEVLALSIQEDTPDNIDLYPHFAEIENLYMVKFHTDYGENKQWFETQNVGTVSTPGYVTLPEIAFTRNGFVKPRIEGVYNGNEKHVIKPSFWYLNDENKLVPFDETVPITKDTDVYVLYRKLNISLAIGDAVSPIVNVTARYENDTRILNSAKDLLYSGGNQLEVALENGRIPGFDAKKQLVIDKLVEKDIIDENKNIKITNVEIPISTFIKEDAAESMIHQYISDTLNDAEKLDAVLSMIDIASIASQMDIGLVLENMTNQELADIISNGGHEEEIAEIIVTDLKGENPTMMDMALHYITTDITFRNKMVTQLINELKTPITAGQSLSALETAAINYIKTILSDENDTTGLQAQFVDMMLTSLDKPDTDPLKAFVVGQIKGNGTVQGIIVNKLIGELEAGTASDEIIDQIKGNTAIVDMIIADIAAGNETLMPSVVSAIKEYLLSDTDGATLRRAILTSDKLPRIIGNTVMKTKILDLLVTSSFLDKVLANAGFRNNLITFVKGNDEFVSGLILSQIHTGDIADDIKNILTYDSVRETIANKALSDENFKASIRKGENGDADGVFREELLHTLSFNTFVADTDDFFKFVFNQVDEENENAPLWTGTYDFIDVNTDIEPIFAEKFSELYTENPTEIQHVYGASTYDDLTPQNKQKFKDDLYAEGDVRDAFLSEMEAHFETYKVSIVDKIANGEAIDDTLVKKEIGNLLADFIIDYINEDITDEAESAVIEKFLVEYILAVIEDESIAESDPIYQIKTDYDAMIADNSIIKSVVLDKKNLVKSIVGEEANYSTLTTTLVQMLNADGSPIYGDVEAAFKDILSGTSVDALIQEYMQENITNTDIDTVIRSYISGMGNSQIVGYIQDYLAIPTNKETAKGQITTYIGGLSVGALATHIKTAATSNAGEVNTALVAAIGAMSNENIEQYVAEFLGVSEDNVTLVRTQIEAFLQEEEQLEDVEEMAKTYIKEEDITADILEFVQSIDEEFVETYRGTLLSVLDGVDLSAMIDKELIITYVGTLSTQEEKDAFATKVYEAFSKTEDYKSFMNSLFNESSFGITESNKYLIQEVAGAIRTLDYDTMMDRYQNAAVNKLVQILGEDLIRSYFEDTRDRYCDGLDIELAKVGNTVTESEYTTRLTLIANPITEIIAPLYEKVQAEVIDKLQNANVYYHENIYLKHLVEDNIIRALLDGDASLAEGDYTGYKVKEIMDYYDYMYKLILVGDDALCWYGENETLTEAEIDAIHEAIVGKVARVNTKLNEILEAFAAEGTLPAPVQQIVDKISKLQSLLDRYESQLKNGILKYLDSNVSDLLGDTEKTGKVVDFLFGQEEDVINIDKVYAVFYNYEDNIQAKLQALIDSGKLQEAVDKFETTSAGDKLFGNPTVAGAYASLYDVLVDLANEGADKFKIASEAGTTIDTYQVSVGAVTLTVGRTLGFYDSLSE